MSIQKLRTIARRGSLFGAVFAIVAATFASAVPTYADALNPLTERSLTLSSSAPGWSNTDGSGNSTYAPPNSGANGQKSGNYFSFKTSSDSTATADKIKAMSFQYCTKSAGFCAAPGDASENTANPGQDDASHSDLNVTYTASATEVAAGDFAKVINTDGSVKAVPGYTNANPKYQSKGGTGDDAEAAKNVAGSFIVIKSTDNGANWSYSPGWTASTSNQEEATSGTTTKQNAIILQNAGEGFAAGTAVKVLFFATNDNYITNPGSGAFFVKINTFRNFSPLTDPTDLAANVATPNNVVDGGVTVANVMNQSIQITTKVLETMQFSVGTVDPNTLTNAELSAATAGESTEHTPCDTIKTSLVSGQTQNVLELGNQDAESSLETAKAYATHSYWRLSSNSSAGATVYYSGHTLSNTSGDEIEPIGKIASNSKPGSEQFGLAIAAVPTTTGNGGQYEVNYNQDRATNKLWENAADNGKTAIDASLTTDLTDGGQMNESYHTPRLYPLQPKAAYGEGSGTINGSNSLDAGGLASTDPSYDATTAKFAFDKMSDTIPTPIADESSQVVDCVTAKMRYVANIAATTPAGIYTTKINYIAAPQY